jgi:hypothetical protein
MIGILLALQVNNWNERNKQRNEEHKLLKEMRASLVKDRKDIISNIEEHESAEKSCDIIMRFLSEDLPYQDSLKVHFSSALNTTRFEHTSGPYETLKIKGPDLIDNDSLRIKLSEYFDARVDYQYDLQQRSLQSFDAAKERQFELFKDFCICLKGMEPVNYEQLKTNQYYRSWLNYTAGERYWEAQNFHRLKGITEDLIRSIDREINGVTD